MVRGTEMSASGCSKGAKAPAREDPAATASTSATDSATATASSSAMASPSAEASTSAVTSSSASAKVTVEKKPSKKPMMEKKRRARMNKSLNELRALISAANSLDAASRHSKLEKADILERTVAHLQDLMEREKRRHAPMVPYENRHESGYRECIAQVKEFFEKNSTGGQRVLSKRLIDHLERHLSARTSSSSPHLDLHQDMMEMRDAAASSRNVRLMPTFMPDGQLVLMMPQSQAHMLGSPSTSSSPVLACASSPIPSISMPIMPAHTRRLPLPSSSPYGSPLSRIYTPNRLSPPISNQGNDEPIDLIKKSIWRTW